MQTVKGKSVYGGIAIGRISIYQNKEQQVKRSRIAEPAGEILRYQKAVTQAKEQLAILYQKAVKEVGEVNAMIFEVHQMMLEDMDYQDAVINMIETQQVNAEYAVAITGDHFSQMFAAMDDDYMRERAADVKDVSNRLIDILTGSQSSGIDENKEPVILLAEDLAPSETVQLDKSKVLSFVTRKGSTNSHTAILARTMNIPALIGVDFSSDMDGKMAIVDGYEGIVYIEPDIETEEKMRIRQQEDLHQKKLLEELKGKDNITLDGKKINLYANMGSVSNLASVLQNDAGGIGLLRSEFLYLEAEDYPTEEEQFQAYKTVAETMAGKKVIIRTLDIGADKQVDYFQLEHEDNPAMGYRAIRICLTREDIFRTQLKAILRASAYGNIGIMYPMIISVEEVRKAKEIFQSVKQELEDQEIPVGQVEQGIMIETPAAVMISDHLAEEVDFFSIGTNDLTQYTLAIDRQNPKLDPFYNPHHEAVLRMIQRTITNGHAKGCWVGICGELGADTTLTETFIRMGVDELSVSPSMIFKVRETIRKSKVK